MSKSQKSAIALAVLAAVTLLVFSACDLFNQKTPRDRFDTFMTEINKADRSNLYKCMDIGATYYAAAMISTYWDVFFPVGAYTASSVADSDPNNFSAVLTGPSQYAAGLTVNFTMVKTGNEYFIKTMAYTIGGVTTEIFK
jgi:hypothetical protein